MEATVTAEQMRTLLTEVFIDKIPFNRLLGMQLTRFDADGIELVLPMQPQFVGNPIQGILHGGVTATMLDVAGGLRAAASMMERLVGQSTAEVQQRLGRLGTVDMRVDYLRPGVGERFIATAEVIRSGSRLAVTRMELHNEEGRHIAFGTGTYVIG